MRVAVHAPRRLRKCVEAAAASDAGRLHGATPGNTPASTPGSTPDFEGIKHTRSVSEGADHTEPTKFSLSLVAAPCLPEEMAGRMPRSWASRCTCWNCAPRSVRWIGGVGADRPVHDLLGWTSTRTVTAPGRCERGPTGCTAWQARARAVASVPDDRLLVYERRAVEDDRPVLIGDRGLQRADGLVAVNVDDFGSGRDDIPGADRGSEVPVHMEEDAARPGRSSATSAFSRPEVTPPCTMMPPKRLLAAMRSS
jgi:hypothetical protein